MGEGSFLAILSLLYGGIIRPELTHGNGHKWSYDGGTSPNQWFKDYPTCNGEKQSPIDIVTSSVVYDNLLRPLDFTKDSSKNIMQRPTIINHERTVSLFVTDGWSLRGGNLDGPYKAIEVNFHWGAEGIKSSEHSVNGIKHDMELHIKHFAEKYGNLDEAIKHEDGIAIVAVFLDVSNLENPLLENIINSLSDIHSSGQMSVVDNFLVTDLLPSDITGYYQYDGSYTNPPCTENVKWFIMRDSIGISYNQINTFYLLKTLDQSLRKTSKIIEVNTRPQQRLNSRIVRCSKPELSIETKDVKNVNNRSLNIRTKRAVNFRFSKTDGQKAVIFSQNAPFSFSQNSVSSSVTQTNGQAAALPPVNQASEFSANSPQAAQTTNQGSNEPKTISRAAKKVSSSAKAVSASSTGQQSRNNPKTMSRTAQRAAKKTARIAKKAAKKAVRRVKQTKNVAKKPQRTSKKRTQKRAKQAKKTAKKVRNTARRGQRTVSTSNTNTNDPSKIDPPVGGLTNIGLGQDIDSLNIGKFMGPAKPVLKKMNTEINPIPNALQPNIYNQKAVQEPSIETANGNTGQDPNAWEMTKSWSSGKAGEAKQRNFDTLHDIYKPVNTVPPVSQLKTNDPGANGNNIQTSGIQSYVIPVHNVPPPAPSNEWTNLNQVNNQFNEGKHTKSTIPDVKQGQFTRSTNPWNSPGVPVTNMETKPPKEINVQTFWNPPAQTHYVDTKSTTVAPSVTRNQPFIIPEAFLASQNNWAGTSTTTYVPVDPRPSHSNLPHQVVHNSRTGYEPIAQSGTPRQIASVVGSVPVSIHHTPSTNYKVTPSPLNQKEISTTKITTINEGQQRNDIKTLDNHPAQTSIPKENQHAQYKSSYYMKNTQPRLANRQNVFSPYNNLFSTKMPGKKTEFSILGKDKMTNKHKTTSLIESQSLADRKEVSKQSALVSTKSEARLIEKPSHIDIQFVNENTTSVGVDANGKNNSSYGASVQGESPPLDFPPTESQPLAFPVQPSEYSVTTQTPTKPSRSPHYVDKQYPSQLDSSTSSILYRANNSSNFKTKEAINWFVDQLHKGELKTNYKELWNILSNSIIKQKSETVPKTPPTSHNMNDMKLNTISDSLKTPIPLSNDVAKSLPAKLQTFDSGTLENIQPQYSAYVEPKVISQSIKKTHRRTNPPPNPVYHQQSFSTVHPGGSSVVSVARDKGMEGTLSLYNPYEMPVNNRPNDPRYMQQGGTQGGMQRSRKVQGIHAQPDILDRMMLPNKQTHSNYHANRMPNQGSQNSQQHSNYPSGGLPNPISPNLKQSHSNYPSRRMSNPDPQNLQQSHSNYPSNRMSNPDPQNLQQSHSNYPSNRMSNPDPQNLQQSQSNYPSNRMSNPDPQNLQQTHSNYPSNRMSNPDPQNLQQSHSNYPSNRMKTQESQNAGQTHYPSNNNHMSNQGQQWTRPPRQDTFRGNRRYPQYVYQTTAKPDYTKPLAAHSTLYHRLQFRKPLPTTTQAPPRYVADKKRPVVFSNRFQFKTSNKRPVFNGGRGSSNSFSATSVSFNKESSFQSNPPERYPPTVDPRSNSWAQNPRKGEPQSQLVSETNYWDRAQVQLVEKSTPPTPGPRQRTFLDSKLGVTGPFSGSTESPIQYNYPVDTQPFHSNNFAPNKGNPTQLSNTQNSHSAFNNRLQNPQYPLKNSGSHMQNSVFTKQPFQQNQHQHVKSQSLLKPNTFKTPTVSPNNASPNYPPHYSDIRHQQPTPMSSNPIDSRPNIKMQMTIDQPPKQAARTQFTNNPTYNIPQNQNLGSQSTQNRNSETPSFYTLGIGSKHLGQNPSSKQGQDPYERMTPKQKLPFVSISQTGNSPPSQLQQNFVQHKNIKRPQQGIERPFVDKSQQIDLHSQMHGNQRYPYQTNSHPTTAQVPGPQNSSNKTGQRYNVPTWQPTRQPTSFPPLQIGQGNMMQPVVPRQNTQWNQQSTVAQPQQNFQQNFQHNNPTSQSQAHMPPPNPTQTGQQNLNRPPVRNQNSNHNVGRTNPLKYKFPAKFDWLKGKPNQFYKVYETTLPPTTTPTTTTKRPVDPAAVHASVSGYGPLLIFG